MLKQLRTATVLLLALTVLTGVVYPALVTIIAQVAFPRQANGSPYTAMARNRFGSQSAVLRKLAYFWAALGDQPMPYNAGGIERQLRPLNPAP